MAVPKKKSSKRRTRNRAATKGLKLTYLSKCPKCGEPKRSHVVCGFCGYYNGKKVLDVESKLDKKMKKSSSAKASEGQGKEKAKESNSALKEASQDKGK